MISSEKDEYINIVGVIYQKLGDNEDLKYDKVELLFNYY
jgi:hypothetical protein